MSSSLERIRCALPSRWAEEAPRPLDRDALVALFDNRIPAIRVPGFATPDECEAFCRAVHAGALRYYAVEPPVGYIGMAQYSYRWGRSRSDYFADVPAAFADQRAVFDASFDPLARVIASLAANWPAEVGIAHEAGLGDYFAGIIRVANAGIRLHADFAPFNAPGYSVASIDAQIGWNIYFEMPGAGGDTVVVNAPWTPTPIGDQPPPSYDLDLRESERAQHHVFTPQVGELVLFNVRNPHQVLPAATTETERSRISIGAFVGRMPDRRLVMWS